MSGSVDDAQETAALQRSPPEASGDRLAERVRLLESRLELEERVGELERRIQGHEASGITGVNNAGDPWLARGFVFFGLLVGTLTGFTTTPIVQSLLALLFAAIGGSLVAFMNKLSRSDRAQAGRALLAMSSATLVGVYSGIWVREHRALSPPARPVASDVRDGGPTARAATIATEARSPDVTGSPNDSETVGPGLLRRGDVGACDWVDHRRANRPRTTDSLEEAYYEMYDACRGLATDAGK